MRVVRGSGGRGPEKTDPDAPASRSFVRRCPDVAEHSIRIMCPNLVCRKVLAVPVSARGKTVRCRNCGTNIRIPNAPVEPGDAKDKPSESAA